MFEFPQLYIYIFMIVRRFKNIQRFLNNKSQFGKKKKDKDQTEQFDLQLDSKQQIAPVSQLNEEGPKDIFTVAVNKEHYKRSAKLYDKYLQTQERPILSKDKYQINFSMIITRPPILYPYDQRNFKQYKDRYNYAHLTGYYNDFPKQLSGIPPAFPFLQFQRSNLDNLVTHRKKSQDPDIKDQLYAQNARYWRIIDPNITDPKSIQYMPTQMVFLIVKNEDGEWKFPYKPMLQKQEFDDMKKNFATELFGSTSHNLYWRSGKPILVTRQQKQLARGVGIKTFYYNVVHIIGHINRYNDQRLFKQHAWVPKQLLADYFGQNYFKQVIRSITTIL